VVVVCGCGCGLWMWWMRWNLVYIYGSAFLERPTVCTIDKIDGYNAPVCLCFCVGELLSSTTNADGQCGGLGAD
jgi:hypothetical protein